MRTLKTFIIVCAVAVLVLMFFSGKKAWGQKDDYAVGVESRLVFNRGILWDDWGTSTHGSGGRYAFENYEGFLFPGFNPDIIKVTGIGRRPLHIYFHTMGMVALRKHMYPEKTLAPLDSDIQQVDIDYGTLTISAGTNISQIAVIDSSLSLVQPVNNFRWPKGENYFLQRNPLEAEEVIDSRTYWNPGYRWSPSITEEKRHFLPRDINRTIRMWSGSKIDQMFEIEQTTITNTSDQITSGYTGSNMTWWDCYVVNQYDVGVNNRGCAFIGASRPRDNLFYFDLARKNLMVIWSDDWLNPASPDKDMYDFARGIGPEKQGEWMSPGFLGIGYIYISPNRYGQENHLSNYWMACITGYGGGTPFEAATNMYNTVVEGSTSNFFMQRDPVMPTFETRYKPHVDPRYQFETWITFHVAGPWDLAPGESITLVVFKGIGSVDPEVSAQINGLVTEATIATGKDSLEMIWDRAKIATRMALEEGYARPGYKGWNLPDPPACPNDFTITNDMTPFKPGNIISWNSWADDHPDPDYIGTGEEYDLDYYTVWRSDYLPMIGWKPIAKIQKKDANYYNAATKKYTYIDRNVAIGASYFYSINSIDTGHKTWPPRPEALQEYPLVFPGGKVLPQESSRQASLNYHFDQSKWIAFRTERNPGVKMSDIVIFPNPFVMRSGYINPTQVDGIHFANIPGKCKIRIYSVRGDLIIEGPDAVRIIQKEGTGEAVWNQETSSGQFVESGLYFCIIESLSGENKGEIWKGKIGIVR